MKVLDWKKPVQSNKKKARSTVNYQFFFIKFLPAVFSMISLMFPKR